MVFTVSFVFWSAIVFLSVGLQSKGEIEELELPQWEQVGKGVVAEQLAGGLEVSLLAVYGTIVSSPVFSNVYFVVVKFTRLITRKCELCTY